MNFSGLVPLALKLIVQLPSELSSAEQAALLDACTQAQTTEPCVLASGGEVAGASIERISDLLFVLEIRVQTENQEQLISREFTFKPEDDALERARALGLSLGILGRSANETPRLEEPVPAPVDSAPPPLKSEQALPVARPRLDPAATQTRRPAQLAAELGLGLGYEPRLRTVLTLGEIRLRYAPTPHLNFIGSGYLSGANTRLDGVPLALFSAAALIGIGFRLPVDAFSVGFDFEGGIERATFAVRDANSQGARWVPVFRASIPISISLGEHSYLGVALRAHFYSSPTQVYVPQRLLGTTSVIVPYGLVGFGLRL